MLVRVKLLGDGSEANSFHADIPTHRLVSVDYVGKTAIAEIMETEHPKLHDHPSAVHEDMLQGKVLVKLDADGHQRWYEHLDDRYQEHKGKFRPEIA